MHPLPKIPPPFPQRLKKKNEDEKFRKFLSVFKNLSINLPLVEALLEMLGYAKFIKEQVTKKMSLDYEMIEVPHSCSAIMTNQSITKKEDPEAFTIPCTIGMLQFAKALCDLGAIINLMPYAIYKQLGLGEPKATTMRLLMADRFNKHPVGILYDILVKVDRFIFPADFVILDCEIDAEIPIILGRPYLAIERALVDIESGKLKFCVNDDEVTFNICKFMKQQSNIHVVSTEDVIVEAVASVSHLMRKNEPLESVIANYDESEVQGYEEVIASLSGLGVYSRNQIKLDINLKNRESPPAKPSTEEPLSLRVKLPIEVLRKHIKAIGWTIADIVGIPSGICTHKIQLYSEYSKWVSPVQCVPENGSITVVPNAKGERVPTRPVTGWRVCMDYRKLNSRTEKDHFPMPFMDQMLDRFSERGWSYFLDEYSGYNQISIAPEDQVKTTFTCPYGTFAFERMSFGLCNAPSTFQRCMLSIFADMVEDSMECLKEKLVSTPIIISPNWSESFQLICDASGTKVIVHTDRAALRYLMAKKDAKPRMIRWELLFQEFDFEVFAISLKYTPWYADFPNYIVCGLMPDELTFYKHKRFMFDVKKYFRDEPYLFRECVDHVIRRCVSEEKAVEILHACHTSPVGGHHGGIRTAAKLVYGKACHLPIELEHKALWELKVLNLDWLKTSRERVEQLNELDEFRLRSYESSAIYKEKMNEWHNARILKRNFKVGDWVLIYNSRLRLFPGNIKSKWSGPFRVTRVFTNGAIEVEDQEGPPFKVNGQ
ncbi:uncharacterized protein [Solanum tuberosum]|uniref:uncharacterized protein n=1 Tax=Solanum tuberosum TaxID=4113 RepID=UPI00073A076E|nr:PREDICTED: uncharacterized protein LOC107061980 [Solanum tuberosum]